MLLALIAVCWCHHTTAVAGGLNERPALMEWAPVSMALRNIGKG